MYFTKSLWYVENNKSSKIIERREFMKVLVKIEAERWNDNDDCESNREKEKNNLKR